MVATACGNVTLRASSRICFIPRHVVHGSRRRQSAVSGHEEIFRGAMHWLEPDDARGSIPGHRHPHVIVSDDVFNRSRVHSVVVCALTSNLARASEPGNVRLEVGEGGLERASVVVVSQVSAVEKSRLGAYIGALSEERVEQIIAGLRFQQTSFFRR